jgi:phosphomevalonate kinase
MQKRAKFFAPGKLFVGGEYAVLSGRGKAIILPTKKGITVTATPRKFYRITNRQFPQQSGRFTSLAAMQNPQVRLAIEVVRLYLLHRKKKLSTFSLIIDSSISNADMKYGLGSSGAVVVAIIGALLTLYQVKFTPLILFKLSVKAVLDHYQDASFGDIATSAFQHPIYYQKFSSSFHKRLQVLSVDRAATANWEGLIIHPFTPSWIKPLVVFTGQPSSSAPLIKASAPFVDGDFIKRSNASVDKLYQQQNIEEIALLYDNLKALAIQSNNGAITKDIATIIQRIEAANGFGKFSGAGGGDCVLGFFPSIKDRDVAKKAIRKQYQIIEDIIES